MTETTCSDCGNTRSFGSECGYCKLDDAELIAARLLFGEDSMNDDFGRCDDSL